MQTVKVRLRKPTRVFTFLSEELPLGRNDTCIVKSDRGLEFGTCILPPEPCTDTMRERLKMNVVRKATISDEATYNQLLIEERRAYDLCSAKIRERNLPMKLVDVEYTFDKHKVVFYFTAADRVDFRQLVRDLAQDLKARIELRHIQVRDEAKLVGGIGVCGRELCCSTWLREFKPISMKMAKRQNLSLNPSKISGQCGRLLCCLSYENEMYQRRKGKEEAERRMLDMQGEEDLIEDDDLSEADALDEGNGEDYYEYKAAPALVDEDGDELDLSEDKDESALDESPTLEESQSPVPGEAPVATVEQGASNSGDRKSRRRRRHKRSRGGPAKGGEVGSRN